MANRDILKEAIADAKSIKEAAIANAKAALEETFTPYLKERFSAKLAEMEDEDMKKEEEEMEENYGKEEMKERLGTINDPDSDDPHGNLEEEDMEEGMSDPVMRHGIKGDDKEEKRTEKMRDKESMDEMNLDELLAELDEELSEAKEKEMEETINEAEESEAERADVDKYEYEKGEEAGEDEGDEEEDEEIDLEDMTEDELKDLIEDVIEDMVRAGELEAGEKFEDDDEEEDIDIDIEDEEEITERKKEGYDDREDESVSARRGKEADKKQSFKARRDDSYGKFGKRDAEAAGKASGPGKNKINKENLNEEEDINEIDLNVTDMEAILAMLTGGIGVPLAVLATTYAKDGIEAVKRLVKGKKVDVEGEIDEMDEMKREIEELASTLSETKLLNAKLLYSNKIFRAKNLNETQKVKVLEAFDKASSVKEAKLIYETLTTVKETKTPVNESVRGMASKAAGMAPEKRPILEVDNQFARWQILAGIKKQ